MNNSMESLLFNTFMNSSQETNPTQSDDEEISPSDLGVKEPAPPSPLAHANDTNHSQQSPQIADFDPPLAPSATPFSPSPQSPPNSSPPTSPTNVNMAADNYDNEKNENDKDAPPPVQSIGTESEGGVDIGIEVKYDLDFSPPSPFARQTSEPSPPSPPSPISPIAFAKAKPVMHSEDDDDDDDDDDSMSIMMNSPSPTTTHHTTTTTPNNNDITPNTNTSTNSDAPESEQHAHFRLLRSKIQKSSQQLTAQLSLSFNFVSPNAHRAKTSTNTNTNSTATTTSDIDKELLSRKSTQIITLQQTNTVIQSTLTQTHSNLKALTFQFRQMQDSHNNLQKKLLINTQAGLQMKQQLGKVHEYVKTLERRCVDYPETENYLICELEKSVVEIQKMSVKVTEFMEIKQRCDILEAEVVECRDTLLSERRQSNYMTREMNLMKGDIEVKDVDIDILKRQRGELCKRVTNLEGDVKEYSCNLANIKSVNKKITSSSKSANDNEITSLESLIVSLRNENVQIKTDLIELRSGRDECIEVRDDRVRKLEEEKQLLKFQVEEFKRRELCRVKEEEIRSIRLGGKTNNNGDDDDDDDDEDDCLLDMGISLPKSKEDAVKKRKLPSTNMHPTNKSSSSSSSSSSSAADIQSPTPLLPNPYPSCHVSNTPSPFTSPDTTKQFNAQPQSITSPAVISTSCFICNKPLGVGLLKVCQSSLNVSGNGRVKCNRKCHISCFSQKGSSKNLVPGGGIIVCEVCKRYEGGGWDSGENDGGGGGDSDDEGVM